MLRLLSKARPVGTGRCWGILESHWNGALLTSVTGRPNLEPVALYFNGRYAWPQRSPERHLVPSIGPPWKRPVSFQRFEILLRMDGNIEIGQNRSKSPLAIRRQPDLGEAIGVVRGAVEYRTMHVVIVQEPYADSRQRNDDGRDAQHNRHVP